MPPYRAGRWRRGLRSSWPRSRSRQSPRRRRRADDRACGSAIRLRVRRRGPTQTAIEFAPKVGALCKRHPEMGPCQYERDLCRRSGGRVFASNGPRSRGKWKMNTTARCCAYAFARIEIASPSCNSIRSISALAAIRVDLCPPARRGARYRREAAQDGAEPTVRSAEAVTGTVHELVVADPTRGTSQRYVELQLADGTLVALQGQAADRLVRDSRVEVGGIAARQAADSRHGPPLPASAATTTKDADGSGRHARDPARRLFPGWQQQLRLRGAPGVRQACNSCGSGRCPRSLETGNESARPRPGANADGESMTPDRITILARAPASAPRAAWSTKAATANSVLVDHGEFQQHGGAGVYGGAGAAGDDEQCRQRRQLLSRDVVRPAGDERDGDAGLGRDEPRAADDLRLDRLEGDRHRRRRGRKGAGRRL